MENITLFRISSYLLIGSLLLIILIIYFSPTHNIKIGEKYQFSYNFDNKNPFEKIKIDTVIIVNIKDNYVQWRYKNGFLLSSTTQSFKINSKLIKYDK